MGIAFEPLLVYLGIMAGLLFVGGVVFTIFRFRQMEEDPREYKGSDPETHYRT